MLHSGKIYQPETSEGSEMSELTDLLKAWMEESHRQEERRQEERELFEKARLKNSTTMKKKDGLNGKLTGGSMKN